MLSKKQLEIEVPRIIKHIKDYFNNAGFSKAIVGNSGGKDSAVVIGLLSKALGNDNVLTVTLPCYSNYKDKEDALLVADTFKVKCLNVVLNKSAKVLFESIKDGYGKDLNEEAIINVKPRLRMTALYAIAQNENALVVGTGNKCEIFIGYFTKHGDGASDYNPLAEFYVEEVYQIAKFIGVPKEILNKAPSDGLSGLSDEDKLKFKYSQVEEYIETGNTEEVAMGKIKRQHEITEHKRNPVPVYHRITDWSKYLN